MASLGSAADVVTLQLRFLPAPGALKVTALAQVLAKALFLLEADCEGPIDATALAAGVRELLPGFPSLPESTIEEAMKLLTSENIVSNSRGGWRLHPEQRANVERERTSHRDRLRNIVRSRFPQSISEGRLTEWFNDTCIEFFGIYGNQTAIAVQTGDLRRPDQDSLKRVIQASARAHGLERHGAELLRGFTAYIENPDAGERTHIWTCWQSMFAARLLMADAGPDPFSSEGFSGAIVYLDTNVLVAFALDAARASRELAAIARAMEIAGIQLRILQQTKEEYCRLMEVKQEQVADILRAFAPEIVKRSSDPFAKTAVFMLGKKNDSNGLSDVASPPGMIGSLLVTLEADAPVSRAADAGEQDVELTRQIYDKSRNRGKRPPKTENVVRHDAALVTAVEYRRSTGERAWVLTEDSGMIELSRLRAGPHALPAWISVLALIQVLGTANGAARLKPAEFGGLLAGMIKNDLHPSPSTYTLEDLERLLEIEAQAAELPDAAVQQLALEISQARLEGRDVRDPRFTLQVERAFTRLKRQHADSNRDARREASELRAELTRERDLAERMRADLEPLKEADQRRKLNNELIRWLLWATPLALVGSGLGLIIVVTSARASVEYPVRAEVSLAVGVALFVPSIAWYLLNLRINVSRWLTGRRLIRRG